MPLLTITHPCADSQPHPNQHTLFVSFLICCPTYQHIHFPVIRRVFVALPSRLVFLVVICSPGLPTSTVPIRRLSLGSSRTRGCRTPANHHRNNHGFTYRMQHHLGGDIMARNMGEPRSSWPPPSAFLLRISLPRTEHLVQRTISHSSIHFRFSFPFRMAFVRAHRLRIFLRSLDLT